jgi:hypothetical protein
LFCNDILPYLQLAKATTSKADKRPLHPTLPTAKRQQTTPLTAQADLSKIKSIASSRLKGTFKAAEGTGQGP